MNYKMTLYDIIEVSERITARVRQIEDLAALVKADSMMLLDTQAEYLRLMAGNEAGLFFTEATEGCYPEDLEDLLRELDCFEDNYPLTTWQRRQIRDWTAMGHSPYSYGKAGSKRKGETDYEEAEKACGIVGTRSQI